MCEIDTDRYWLVARDKPALLRAMMRELAGDARISFEGDLTRCEFGVHLEPRDEETSALHRQTAFPRQDFVVLPLEPHTVQPILDIVLQERRYMTDIVHVQIEKMGCLEFGSYDNFHPECIVCFHGITPAVLDGLLTSGVIKSWTTPYEGRDVGCVRF
jgi:hypothetical protein